MPFKALSIRPFIGAKNYAESRSFYSDLGFEESVLSRDLSLFRTESFGFYLQDAYVRDWIDNLMVFMEVDNVDHHWEYLLSLDLTTKYPDVRLTPIREYEWGKECFIHDPSGVLWHFGQFR